ELEEMLKQITPLGMRLQIKEGVNDCMIVDDTYNADFDSLSIALQFLNQQGQKPVKTIILSDMLQSGAKPNELYKRIARLLATFQLNKVISIGEDSALLKSYLPDEVLYRHFKTTKSFLQHYHSSDFQHEAILVKGARQFAFESIVQALSKRSHRTILEVNLTALLHNLNVYSGFLKPGVKMMVMVKASAYGAGSDEVAKLLQYQNVDYLCVAYPDEGVDLRKAGIKLPIMVLNPDENSINSMITNKLEPEVYSLSILKAIINQVPPGSNVIGVHIKLDTGMNRLGFTETDKAELIQLIQSNRQINIKSIFTHLSASENPIHDVFTHKQGTRFKKYTDDILGVLDYKPLLHVLNSSGISRFKEYQLDMVRLGIGLYGYDASDDVNQQLKTVHTLKALISQIKQVSAKETVGYGRKGKLTENKRIATISIGYADGFQRKLGNGNYTVLIKGKEAQTIGNVCMDMTMVDINHIPEVNEGDEVIIFGELLPVKTMAEKLETIPYEVFTGISSRVKRVYFQE
ncbi:MAG TPA: alanine racemase, partial [Saprospiraceae bacterium]|nr:alanine racemase [Saprospiraceae bacterium]